MMLYANIKRFFKIVFSDAFFQKQVEKQFKILRSFEFLF